MTFRSSNERLKDAFNDILRQGTADVGALHHQQIRHMRVAMLDAMDGEGKYPRTARALGQAGIDPTNMRIISCNHLETRDMRSAIQHSPLHPAKICEVTLGRAEPLPFSPRELHMCILDGCSGRPNTLKMVREMLPFLRSGAVVVVGITRRHNQDPLPAASQRDLEMCVAEADEEEDPRLEDRLKRLASVQLVQHRTQLDMAALGARPFWPMWQALGALSYDGYGEQNLMVYMPFVVGGGQELLDRQPWPLRVHEGGVRLLEGEFATRTLRRVRALTEDENTPRQTRSQAKRKLPTHQEEAEDVALPQKRVRKLRTLYTGVYCPPRTAPPRVPVGSRWKYVPRT